MLKESFCELLPPGISNVNDLLKSPNKREVFLQPSDYRHENSPVTEKGKFSQETREKLLNEGFEIYQLKGISIRDLKQELKSRGAYHIDLLGLYDEKHYPFITYPSRKSEVAFNPPNWLLPETKDKDFYAGSTSMRDFAHKIKKDLEIIDIETIIGEAADYIDLIIQHFNKTRAYLLIQGNGLKRFETQNIDTITFVGTFQYYLGSGFGYGNEISEYAYISADFNPEYGPKDNQTYLQAQKSKDYQVCIGHHCRCHPVPAGIAPLIVPR